MTKLTEQMRKTIALSAVTEQFKDEELKFKNEEHDLAMMLYLSLYDEKLLKQINKIPTEWLRMDACLRFNCGGYDLRFNVNKAVPVPYETHCSRLGIISGELGEKAQSFANRKKDMQGKVRKAHVLLLSMLSSITTFKKLEQVWPDGKKFYSAYLDKKDNSYSVPVVQIDEINKMLGLIK